MIEYVSTADALRRIRQTLSDGDLSTDTKLARIGVIAYQANGDELLELEYRVANLAVQNGDLRQRLVKTNKRFEEQRDEIEQLRGERDEWMTACQKDRLRIGRLYRALAKAVDMLPQSEGVPKVRVEKALRPDEIAHLDQARQDMNLTGEGRSQ